MSALDQAQQWVATHRGAAAAGAGGVGVVGLALYRRRHAAAAAGGAGAGATGSSSGDPNAAGNADGAVNGLSDPTDYRAEIENYVADQLAAQNSAMQAALNRRTPTPVTPAKPAPRPGSFRYKILHGDTLQKIADRLFGEHDARTLNALKHANPILATFGAGSRLDYYAGQTIAVPGVKPLNPKPKPKPKAKPKPREHAPRPAPHAPKPQPIKRRRRP